MSASLDPISCFSSRHFLEHVIGKEMRDKSNSIDLFQSSRKFYILQSRQGFGCGSTLNKRIIKALTHY